MKKLNKGRNVLKATVETMACLCNCRSGCTCECTTVFDYDAFTNSTGSYLGDAYSGVMRDRPSA